MGYKNIAIFNIMGHRNTTYDLIRDIYEINYKKTLKKKHMGQIPTSDGGHIW